MCENYFQIKQEKIYLVVKTLAALGSISAPKSPRNLHTINNNNMECLPQEKRQFPHFHMMPKNPLWLHV